MAIGVGSGEGGGGGGGGAVAPPLLIMGGLSPLTVWDHIYE